MFCQILENISKQVAWYLSAVYKTFSGHYRHGHYTLILALKKHDAEEAKKIMEDQLFNTSEAFLKLINENSTEKSFAEPILDQHT